MARTKTNSSRNKYAALAARTRVIGGRRVVLPENDPRIDEAVLRTLDAHLAIEGEVPWYASAEVRAAAEVLGLTN